MINAMKTELTRYGHFWRSCFRCRIRNIGTAHAIIVATTTPDHRTGMCDIEVRGSARATWGVSTRKKTANNTKCKTEGNRFAFNELPLVNK
jgi:hypothetical protein